MEPLPKHNTSSTYRRDIDGLRALAVLSVVGYHAFPEWFPGGFIGVDIFFVISGYLITSILLENIHHKKFSITDFYARRIRRLFPALIFVLIACLVVGWLVFLSDEYKTLGKNIVASTLFASNFFLWTEANYFDTASEFKPILHLWSLAVEEQFYILWPALLFLLSRRKNYLLYGMTTLLLISFVSCISNLNDSVSRFYLPNNRFWELLIGALLTQGYKVRLYENISQDIKSLAGLILIIIAVFALNKHSVFPGWTALLPTVGAFLLISSGEHAWVNHKIFSTSVAVFIGLVSYPLYLWHWPLLAFAKVISGGEISLTLRIICVVVSFVLAWITFQFIERAWRRPRKLSIPTLLLIAILIGVAGYFCANGAIKPRSVSFGIEHILKEIDEWEMPKKENEINFENQHFFSQGNQNDMVMFIGDSNMAQYAARINKLVSENKTTKGALFATTGGCMPVRNVGRIDNDNCLPLMRSAYHYAKENNSISTVVIGALWISYLYGAESYYHESDASYPVSQNAGKLYAALTQDIQELTRSGKKVYIIVGMPSNGGLDPRRLFNRSATDFRLEVTSVGGVSREALLNIEGINVQLIDVAEKSGAKIINPFEYLCSSTQCPLFTIAGQMIYKDADHLTMNFVRDSASYLDQTMQ